MIKENRRERKKEDEGRVSGRRDVVERKKNQRGFHSSSVPKKII